MHCKSLFIIAVTIAVMACGCTSATAPEADSTAATRTVTDDYSRTVQVPTHPRRIVSTSPAVTEILFAIGADSLLVGRTDFCVYPLEAQRITSIGGISNLNVENILALSPDLVISGSMIPKKSAMQLDKMGIPAVHVIEKQRFDGLYDNIRTIGALAGHAAKADSLATALHRIMDSLRRDSVALPVSAYYVVGYGNTGNFTACGNTFIDDIITLAGGRNIAHDLQGWSYSLEALLDADPDYIVIRREDSASFCRTAPYSSLTAVRRGRVIAIESGIIDLQVPRNIDAVLLLRQRFSAH